MVAAQFSVLNFGNETLTPLVPLPRLRRETGGGSPEENVGEGRRLEIGLTDFFDMIYMIDPVEGEGGCMLSTVIDFAIRMCNIDSRRGLSVVRNRRDGQGRALASAPVASEMFINCQCHQPKGDHQCQRNRS